MDLKALQWDWQVPHQGKGCRNVGQTREFMYKYKYSVHMSDIVMSMILCF